MSRVSEQMRFRQTNDRIAATRTDLDRVQETASSGQRLRKVSDDPAAAVRVNQSRERLKNIEQYRKTLDFSRGFLGRSEDALRGMNETLSRAKELAVQQANATWSKDDRLTVAKEMRQLIEHTVSLGNSAYGDRYVFGGFRTQHPPIAQDGAYLGDDGQIYVQLDEDVYYPVNVSGRDIFGIESEEEGEAETIVQTLRGLYEGLESDDIGKIQNAIGRIDDATDRVVDALATVGSRRTMVEHIESRLDISEEHYYSEIGRLQSADLVQTSLDLKRAQTAVQYTLQASGQVLTPSLLQFLK